MSILSYASGSKTTDSQDTFTDSWVEKEGFLMYGKTPCKKVKYSSQKVKYSSTWAVPSNDEYIPVPKKAALDSLVEFSPPGTQIPPPWANFDLWGVAEKRGKKRGKKRKKERKK